MAEDTNKLSGIASGARMPLADPIVDHDQTEYYLHDLLTQGSSSWFCYSGLREI